MAFQAVENPAITAPSGAGIQAAQFVIEHGAQAVVTGSTGPNAFQVFRSAGVPVCLSGGGTVQEAAEAYRAGQIQTTGGATA
jgi:predicted Fe-Mo cluster-binding NifX family protein